MDILLNFARRQGVYIHGLTIAIVVLLTIGQVPLGHGIDDPFQEGEYLTWSPMGRAPQPGLPPVLIHGGLDVWPAAVGCPEDHRILCVRAINTGLHIGSIALLMGLLGLAVGFGTIPALLASLPTLVLLLGVGGSHGSPVAQHQGTPGLRDILMLAGLCLMVHAARRIDRGVVSMGSFAALGALATFAPLWAYNRGLMLVLVAGLFTLAVCAIRRTARPALAGVAGGALALLALLAFGAGPTLVQASNDIVYWAQNAGLWYSVGARSIRALAVSVHLVALGLAGLAAWRAWRMGRPGTALVVLALGATAALYVNQALERPDSIHMRWTLWIATVLMGIGLRDLLRWRPGRLAGAVGVAAVLFTAGTAYRLADYSPHRWRFWPGLMANARLLVGPKPTDRMLAGDDLVQIADLVRAAGRCTFAANNASLIHLLSGMPPCSRFAHGNYIARANQAQVTTELEDAAPHYILWSATAWWANIDGRTFTQNSPDLAAWIEARYPIETTFGVHTIRSVSPLNAWRSRASDAIEARTER